MSKKKKPKPTIKPFRQTIIYTEQDGLAGVMTIEVDAPSLPEAELQAQRLFEKVRINGGAINHKGMKMIHYRNSRKGKA